MRLQEGEIVLKEYHHHFLFFLVKSVKVWLYSIPLLGVWYFISMTIPQPVPFVGFAVIAVSFFVVEYFFHELHKLDRLVITNKRIIYEKWRNYWSTMEIEALLDDIQNIETEENGIFAKLSWFDYGSITVETSSTSVIVKFDEAPDPEEIKFYIYDIMRKHVGFGDKDGSGAKMLSNAQKSLINK